MKKYTKLVRDKIPEIIEARGEKYSIYIADDQEYGQKLKDKLQEEVSEFFEQDDVSELADILEVIYAIAEYNKISIVDLENIREEKALKRGSFKKKIILKEA